MIGSLQALRASRAIVHAGPSTRTFLHTAPKRALQNPLASSTFPRSSPILSTSSPLRASASAQLSGRIPRGQARNATTSATASGSSRQRANEQEQPEPDDDEPPAGGSAYARFKALSKKYGWWALGMYTFLSSIDFTLSFILVHAAGAERIEPYIHSALQTYRRIRHGAEEAARLEQEQKDKAAAEDREEKDKLAAMTPEERAKYKKAGQGWGSKTLWAEIALAYAIHKTLLLPIRAGLTVAVTPKFVKWMAARGWVGKVRDMDGRPRR